VGLLWPLRRPRRNRSKSQYASLRLRRLQSDVAMFASELLRIKAQIMCDLYRPETLIQMSGIMATPDAQYAEQAIQLMKSEPSRGFRIEVASDSLVEMDEASEKASRTEFMQAFGTVMRESLPMVQAAPEMGPLIGEVLTFVVRTFRGGRALENVLEQTIAKMNEPKQPQQQGPSPEEIQAQAEQQNAQMAAQLEQAKLAQAMQLEQAKLAQSLQLEQFKAQQSIELERMRQEYESQRAQLKAQIDAQTKIEIAAMNAKAVEKPAVVMSLDGKEQLDSVSDEVMALAQNATDGIGAHAQAMTQAVELLADAVNQMNKPKRRVLQRGPDGRAIGVVELPE
jgi:DNA polymerase III gamma/tau subunit